MACLLSGLWVRRVALAGGDVVASGGVLILPPGRLAGGWSLLDLLEDVDSLFLLAGLASSPIEGGRLQDWWLSARVFICGCVLVVR